MSEFTPPGCELGQPIGLVVTTNRHVYTLRDKRLEILRPADTHRLALTGAALGSPRFAQRTPDYAEFSTANCTIQVWSDDTVLITAHQLTAIQAEWPTGYEYMGQDSTREFVLLDGAGGVGVFAQGPHRTISPAFTLDPPAGRRAITIAEDNKVLVCASPTRGPHGDAIVPLVVFGHEGRLPGATDLAGFAQAGYTDLLVMHQNDIYEAGDPVGEIADPDQYGEFVRAAHDAGLLVVAYNSPFYNRRAGLDTAARQLSLATQYGVDGAYLDGMFFKYGQDASDPIGSLHLVREMRAIVGWREGRIYAHLSQNDSRAPWAFVAAYADVVRVGERVYWNGEQDPYRWVAEQAHLGNARAEWLHGLSMTHRQAINATLGLTTGCPFSYAQIKLTGPDAPRWVAPAPITRS